MEACALRRRLWGTSQSVCVSVDPPTHWNNHHPQPRTPCHHTHDGFDLQATAAPQGKDGSATDVMNSAKRLVTAADLRQQADRLGVPLRWNSRHPVRTVDALRLVLSAPAHERQELSMALYKYCASTRRRLIVKRPTSNPTRLCCAVLCCVCRAYWQDDRDVANVETLAQIAKGFSVSVDAVADPKYKQALRDTTDEAVKRGAFGVPSLYSLTAERIFWGEVRGGVPLSSHPLPPPAFPTHTGCSHSLSPALSPSYTQDRLHFAMQAEGFPREQCEQPRLALPTAATKPRKLTYYHDFSSPFSYLASTQAWHGKAPSPPPPPSAPEILLTHQHTCSSFRLSEWPKSVGPS